MNSTLYILIVLYNKKIQEISGLDNFLKLKSANRVTIAVTDNSDKEEIKNCNSEIVNSVYSDKIVYIDNGGNIGLSKSYNKAIKFLKKEDYIMFSDDDTVFSIEYLENVVSSMENDQCEIFTGVVKTANGYMSPLKKFKIRVSADGFIKEPGIYNNIYAINSGLVLSKKVIDKIEQFPEQLFLDMIDYWLMDTLILSGLNKIKVLPGDIIQDFSGEEKYSKQLIKRYKIYKNDLFRYSRLIPKRKFKCAIIALNRRLGIFIKRFKR